MIYRKLLAAGCAALVFATVVNAQNAEGGSPVAEHPDKTADNGALSVCVSEGELSDSNPASAHNTSKSSTRRPLKGADIKLTDMNLQLQYDFGSDRRFVTLTYEMFHPDSWGNTFFFVDVDFNFIREDGKNIGPSGAYTELCRSLNFWQGTCMRDFCLQVEYNGGLGSFNGGGYNGAYAINHAFLVGANYTLHTKDYRYLLTLQLLYKKFIEVKQTVPMQFTAVWNCRDLFGARGLNFTGYLDIWNEDHRAFVEGGEGEIATDSGVGNALVLQSEPQLWYCVGQWFGCPHLNIGGEVEFSLNFAGTRGFRARPCLGLKWIF